MDSSNRFSIGIDISDRTACVCVMDRSGVLEEFRIALDEDAIRGRVPFVGPDKGVVVFETGPRSAWLKGVFERLGMRVVVADARKLEMIAKSPKKTDRNDARMLARLGLADELTGSSETRLLCDTFVRPPELQRIYDQLVARDLLVRRRGDFVRMIRSIVKGTGQTLRGRASTFDAQLETMAPDVRVATAPLLTVVEACDTSIAGMDRGLAALAKSDPDARRLKTVDGVGPIIALAFRCVVGDPGRFSNVRDVGAYLGLTPKRDQSGQLDPKLGISKCGNGFMRRLLLQGAAYILGPFGKPCALRHWGLTRIEAMGTRVSKKVRVAVARKLAVQLLSIWKNEREWVAFPDASPDEHPSATDGSADCVPPLDAPGLDRKIAAAPTDPIQPCARPSGARTDESAESRRVRASGRPSSGRPNPASRSRRGLPPAEDQAPGMPRLERAETGSERRRSKKRIPALPQGAQPDPGVP